ncbi:hypothetical protein QBC47DRAFT_444627, partial [Echria macrotheca]
NTRRAFSVWFSIVWVTWSPSLPPHITLPSFFNLRLRQGKKDKKMSSPSKSEGGGISRKNSAKSLLRRATTSLSLLSSRRRRQYPADADGPPAPPDWSWNHSEDSLPEFPRGMCPRCVHWMSIPTPAGEKPPVHEEDDEVDQTPLVDECATCGKRFALNVCTSCGGPFVSTQWTPAASAACCPGGISSRPSTAGGKADDEENCRFPELLESRPYRGIYKTSTLGSGASCTSLASGNSAVSGTSTGTGRKSKFTEILDD